ncbi:hypothetical protein ASD97_28045 [Streptomyces sp. Root63]|nr:hypothetical protein ASD97_28045 [Streptomyces sp. Root63]
MDAYVLYEQAEPSQLTPQPNLLGLPEPQTAHAAHKDLFGNGTVYRRTPELSQQLPHRSPHATPPHSLHRDVRGY